MKIPFKLSNIKKKKKKKEKRITTLIGSAAPASVQLPDKK